jgi:hypothetical protein
MGQVVNARVGVFGCLELEVLGTQRFAKTSGSVRAHLINRPRVVPTSASPTSITAPSCRRPCCLLVLLHACENCRPHPRTAATILVSILDHRAFLSLNHCPRRRR